MKIRITRTVRLNHNIVKNVVSELIRVNGPLIFVEERIPLMFEEGNFGWSSFFKKCTEYRKENDYSDGDFLVVLTELRNQSNWFSAFSTDSERTIFVHAADWESYVYAEAQYPIAYEVIANVMQSTSFNHHGDDLFKHVHNEPIGCMNDMCGWKPDITFKLRTGDICPDCLALFSSCLPTNVIEQALSIIEVLRKRMLFSRDLHLPLSFEENLPFTVAITKRKMGTTLEPFRKILMLIDHFDSLVRNAVLLIVVLTKPKKEIEAFLIERRLHHLPSLGNWVDALAALASTESNHFVDLQLPRDFALKVREVVQLANDNRITHIRNEKRGHGYVDCHDSSYKDLFMKCIVAVEDIEQLLSPLYHRFHYLHTISLNRIAGNSFRVLAYSLSGSNPAFIEKEITASFEKVEDIPMEKRFYLVTPDMTKWIDMDPYIQYGLCNLCHHNRLLVYDGAYMLDPYIGHRFQLS